MTWLRESLTTDGVVTTTDTWLLARLGAGYVTDATTASRTLLLDLDGASWSAEACSIFGLDGEKLPVITNCAAITGETSAFGTAIPVAGLAVDQQAALLAERCFTAGQAKCTYGTGAFLLATTGTTAVRSAGGLAASVALLASSVASDLGGRLTVLRADGGLTRSRLVMQAQADLLQLPVEVCRTPDATALGVAALASIGMGQAAGIEQAVGPAAVESVIEPRIGAEAAERLASFASAQQAVLNAE